MDDWKEKRKKTKKINTTNTLQYITHAQLI